MEYAVKKMDDSENSRRNESQNSKSLRDSVYKNNKNCSKKINKKLNEFLVKHNIKCRNVLPLIQKSKLLYALSKSKKRDRIKKFRVISHKLRVLGKERLQMTFKRQKSKLIELCQNENTGQTSAPPLCEKKDDVRSKIMEQLELLRSNKKSMLNVVPKEKSECNYKPEYTSGSNENTAVNIKSDLNNTDNEAFINVPAKSDLNSETVDEKRTHTNFSELFLQNTELDAVKPNYEADHNNTASKDEQKVSSEQFSDSDEQSPWKFISSLKHKFSMKAMSEQNKTDKDKESAMIENSSISENSIFFDHKKAIESSLPVVTKVVGDFQEYFDIDNCENNADFGQEKENLDILDNTSIDNSRQLEAMDCDFVDSPSKKSSVIKPTKTSDVTKIKGWRSKLFLHDQKDVKEDEEPSNKKIKLSNDSTLPLKEESPVESSSNILKDPDLKKSSSAFESDVLDKFLTNAKLNISYEIPKLVAEDTITKLDSKLPLKNRSPSPQSLLKPIKIKYLNKSEFTNKIKPKTLAEKRKLFENYRQKELLHEIELNELSLLKTLRRNEKRQKLETLVSIREKLQTQKLPVSRECWLAAMTANDVNSLQIVKYGNETIRIAGSSGGPTIQTLNKIVLSEIHDNIRSSDMLKSEITSNEQSENSSTEENSLTYKPGPLSKKPSLVNKSDAITWNSVLKDMPQAYLLVYPELGKRMHPIAEQYLELQKDIDGYISKEWAEYAASVLISKENSALNEKIECKFPLSLANNRNKVLMKEQNSKSFINVKPLEKLLKHEFIANNSVKSVMDEVKEVMTGILNYLETPNIDNSVMDYCPDCPEFKETSFTPPSPIDEKVQAIIKTKRTSRTELELKRLNVQVIEVNIESEQKKVEEEKENREKECTKPFCKMGCVCLDITAEFPNHCERVCCMLQCQCSSSKLERQQKGHHYINLPRGSNLLSAGTMVRLQDEAKRHLAKEERKFTQTVIKANDQTIVVSEGTRDRRSKRVTKLPKKYSENHFVMPPELYQKSENYEEEASVEENVSPKKSLLMWSKKNSTSNQTEQKSLALNTKKIVVVERLKLDNIMTWCMVHNLYKCFCNGSATEDSLNSSSKKRIDQDESVESNDDYITYSSRRLNPNVQVVRNLLSCARVRGVPNFYSSRNKAQACKQRNIKMREQDNVQLLKEKLNEVTKQPDDTEKQQANIYKVKETHTDELAIPDLYMPTPFIKKHLQEIVFKNVPNASNFRLMEWNTIERRFRNCTLFFWYNPSGKSPLILTKTRRRPGPSFTNIKNYDYHAQSNLPEIVTSLLSEKLPGKAIKKEDTYAILVSNGLYWEIRGTIIRKPNEPDIAIKKTVMRENRKQKLEERDKAEISLESKEIPSVTAEQTVPSENSSIKVPLPVGREDSRWFMMILENDFSVLKLTDSSYSIKYTDLIHATATARTYCKTVRLPIQRDKPSFIKSPAFGVYAVPGLAERVFFGPYGPTEEPSIHMFRYINGRLVNTKEVEMFYGTNRKSRGIWLYTKGQNTEQAENVNAPTELFPSESQANRRMHSASETECIDLTELDDEDDDIIPVIPSAKKPRLLPQSKDSNSALIDLTTDQNQLVESYNEVSESFTRKYDNVKRSNDITADSSTNNSNSNSMFENDSMPNITDEVMTYASKHERLSTEDSPMPQLIPLTDFNNWQEEINNTVIDIDVNNSDDEKNEALVNMSEKATEENDKSEIDDKKVENETDIAVSAQRTGSSETETSEVNASANRLGSCVSEQKTEKDNENNESESLLLKFLKEEKMKKIEEKTKSGSSFNDSDDDLEIISTHIATKLKDKDIWLVSEPPNLGYIPLKTHLNGMISVVSPLTHEHFQFKNMEHTIQWIDRLLRKYLFFVPETFQVRMFLVDNKKKLRDHAPLSERQLRGFHMVCEKGLFDMTLLTRNEMLLLGFTKYDFYRLEERKTKLHMQKLVNDLAHTLVCNDTSKSYNTKEIINMTPKYIKNLEFENVKIKIEKYNENKRKLYLKEKLKALLADPVILMLSEKNNELKKICQNFTSDDIIIVEDANKNKKANDTSEKKVKPSTRIDDTTEKLLVKLPNEISIRPLSVSSENKTAFKINLENKSSTMPPTDKNIKTELCDVEKTNKCDTIDKSQILCKNEDSHKDKVDTKMKLKLPNFITAIKRKNKSQSMLPIEQSCKIINGKVVNSLETLSELSVKSVSEIGLPLSLKLAQNKKLPKNAQVLKTLKTPPPKYVPVMLSNGKSVLIPLQQRKLQTVSIRKKISTADNLQITMKSLLRLKKDEPENSSTENDIIQLE